MRLRLPSLPSPSLVLPPRARPGGAGRSSLRRYNVENYVGATPKEPGERATTRPKTEEAIAALIRIIKEINPDVLGVCEMGSPERFDDFKKRLGQANLGYIDSEYVQAADPDRHVALVSRFPIVARNSRSGDALPFEEWTESPKRCGAVSSM